MDAPATGPHQFQYALLLREIDRMRTRDGVTAVALVLVQLDGLHEINEKFGYMAGDKVLAEFASRMAGVARAQDCILALKATSYAFLIRDPLHEGHAVLGADKVARTAGEAFAIGGSLVRIRVHMGISLLPDPARNAEDLLRQCEIALRAARLRDESYVVYTDGLMSPADSLVHAWFDVHEALRQGEFQLHFQPKIALGSGRLCGAEALIRWNSPEMGLVPPGTFLPALESGREVRPLLWFCLNAALREAAGWLKECPDFQIAVNVATGNLEDSDLVALTTDALHVWGFPPTQLILEVTETALMKDVQASIEVLRALRAVGVRISIDDFGTGYSSLTYLRTLPADELKIDRSFIVNVATDEADRQLVESVIGLGHAVQLKVVAEGIESAEVMTTVKSLGCDIGQGYFFDRARPAEEFTERWVRSLTP